MANNKRKVEKPDDFIEPPEEFKPETAMLARLRELAPLMAELSSVLVQYDEERFPRQLRLIWNYTDHEWHIRRSDCEEILRKFHLEQDEEVRGIKRAREEEEERQATRKKLRSSTRV